MTEEKNPHAATGLPRIAEKAVPRPHRRKPAPVKAPAKKPSITPKPAAAKTAPPVQHAAPKQPETTGKTPHLVPNFVLKHADRGTRVVHTFKGKGVWEVWQEAYESREEIYDAALKDALPSEGYWMEDGLIQDQLGDFLYDGPALPWRWYATLEETETRHAYYA
jgi:hypothetical protein